MPCCRFAIKYDGPFDHADSRTVYPVYRYYYVPAVEFDTDNPGTGDAGVYAVAAVSLLSLIAAQYVYKKSKRV